jgi:hypothetical protein
VLQEQQAPIAGATTANMMWRLKRCLYACIHLLHYRELAAAASTLQELLCGRWSSAKGSSGSVTAGAAGGSAAAGDSGSVGGYSCTDDMEAYSQVSSTR